MHWWVGSLSCGPGICVSRSTSGLGVRVACNGAGLGHPVG